jgi:hypothetical protein
LHCVTISRQHSAKPISLTELRTSFGGAYGDALTPFRIYWPRTKEMDAFYAVAEEDGGPPASMPSQVTVSKALNGQAQFSVDVSVGNSWPAGMYYVLVFAKLNGVSDPVLISGRTLTLYPGSTN